MGNESAKNLQQYIEEETGIEEFINKYRNIISEDEILAKQSATNVSEGNFDSDLWILYHDISQISFHIKFEELRDLEKFKKVSSQEIDILKSYLVEEIMDGYDSSTIHEKFKYIKEFILTTKNFDWVSIDNKNGNLIDTILDNALNDEKRSRLKYSVLGYLDFLDSYALITENQIKVYSYLSNKHFGTTKNEVRKLPSTKDIFSFDYVIKDFFENHSSEEEECLIRKIYRPLLIWWKLGNVIPFRVSEICRKIPRDCIYEKDGSYYLKIDRVKVNLKNRKVKRSVLPSIPLLKELEITEYIYNLIKAYLEETEFDSDSETLFSYKAIVQFRRYYMKIKRNQESIIFSVVDAKFKKNSFSSRVMDSLLLSFYTQVVEGKYNVYHKDYIKLGVPRHLAFSSLVYQGVNPVDIAMLGGHTNIQTQDHYIGHARYYIDSEIIDFVTGRKLPRENYGDSLARKILKETSWNPPKSLNNCTRTEDEVGYCTADFKNDQCDDVILCPYCTKWWCEPTNESFIKVRKYIQDNNISPLMKLVDQQEKFLHKLIAEAEVVNVNGLIEMERSDSEKIRELSFKIRSNADRLLYFKKSLIEMRDKSILK